MSEKTKTIYDQAVDDLVALGLLVQHEEHKEFFVRTQKAWLMGEGAFDDAFQTALVIRGAAA
jgi:hypothetical protein